MKKILYGLGLCAVFSLSSCIQDEPLNSECDIETAEVLTDDANGWLLNASEAVKAVSSSDSVIIFYLKADFADWDKLKALAVQFKLTPGATITPESGTVHDFSGDGVHYRVTSEDGEWHRDYRVRFTLPPSLPTEYPFENYRWNSTEKYREWFEYSEFDGSEFNMWATGNPGFAISRSAAKPEEYPTIPWDETSVSGHAVKLETCSTGLFGSMMSMPIAAGNLFIGTFDVSNALQDAMAATRFGLPFNKKPVSFEAYYRYKPGPTFINRSGAVQEGRVDTPDLYAVLYRNTDENGQAFTLQGDNVLTHPNIVAIARNTDYVHDFDNWTHINIPFEYREEIDRELLRSYGYSLAVVFTSSIEGASFCGAVGSTLIVDEARVICEEE